MPSKNNTTKNINQLVEELSMEDPFNESIMLAQYQSQQLKNSENIHKTIIPNPTHEIPIEFKDKKTPIEPIEIPVERKTIENPKKVKKARKPKKAVEKLNKNEYKNNVNNMRKPKEQEEEEKNNYYTNYENKNRTIEPEDTDNYYSNMNIPLRNSYYGGIPRTRRNQRVMDYDNNYDNFFGKNFFDFGGLNKSFRGMNNNLFGNFFM